MRNGNGGKTKKRLTGEAKARTLSPAELEKMEAERKQVEEALRAEKNKLQSILSSIENGISILDRDYSILYQNRPSGIDGAYHLGEKCYRAYEGRDEVCDGCPVAKTFRDGKSHSSERQGVSSSGEAFYVENTANPMRDDKGKIISCLEVTRDITERKQAEEALRQSEERFRSIVEHSQAGVMILDNAYRCIYANDELCRISKRSRKEIIGQDFRQFLDEESKQLVADRYIRRQRGEEVPPRYEFNIIRKDGQKRRVEISSAVIKDSTGAVKTVAQILDITEREQSEEELQAEKNKLQSIISSIEYAISIHDRDYNILYQSRPSTKDGGYHLGEKCYQAYEGRNEICVGCAAEKAFKDGKSHTSERKVLLPSGKAIVVESTASPLKDAEGKIVSCLEVSRDITERKQAEDALQGEKNKLQSVIDALGYGLNIQDKDYNIIYQNEISRMISGGNHLGEKCYRVYEGRNKICDGCPVAKAFRDGKSHTSERKVVSSSGEVVYWENVASPVRDSRGKIVSGLEVVRNVTKRKQAEEKLRESEVSLTKAQRVAKMGSWDLDLATGIGTWSAEMFRLTGFDPSKGAPGFAEFLEWVHPEDQQRIYADSHERVRRTGKSATFEFRSNPARGPVQNFLANVSATLDAQGRVVKMMGTLQDITERKRMEEVLRVSEEALRKMFESVTDGIWVIDLHGVITKVNDRAVEMHGFSSKDELMGKNALEFIAPSDQRQAKANMREVLKEGAVRDVEYTLLRADGSEFPGELSTSALRDADGNCVGHITVSRDITERKQVEEELKLRAKMLDSATDSIFVHDSEGNFIYVNEAACRVHGYSREEFMKMKVTQITPPRTGVDVSGIDQQMRKKGELTFEATHLCKDGSLIPMDVHCRLVESGGRKIVLAAARDITERKRVEEELKLRAQLLDSATDAIFVHDLDENFIYVNEAASRILGYSREEFMKMKVSQIFPPDQVDNLLALRQKTLGKGELVFETAHLCKDGSLKPVEVHNRTVESGGRKLILASARDITERKQAEQDKNDLEQKAHLASRLASVGEMASGIAHEINNPLTAVIGFAQLLMDADLPDETKEDIAIIHKEAQRAAGVARNLLTFARKHAPTKQPTNLNNIIEGVLKLRAYEQNVSNIQINNHLAPDLPEVMADYSQLQQVFINLILNAEAAMLEANNGGILTITTQKVNDIVRASFADNGPGISEENMKRIFDPFFTTKEVGKGTGLGLSVCHGIVTEHGGKIYAKSKQGSGATFIIDLPISS